MIWNWHPEIPKVWFDRDKHLVLWFSNRAGSFVFKKFIWSTRMRRESLWLDIMCFVRCPLALLHCAERVRQCCTVLWWCSNPWRNHLSSLYDTLRTRSPIFYHLNTAAATPEELPLSWLLHYYELRDTVMLYKKNNAAALDSPVSCHSCSFYSSTSCAKKKKRLSMCAVQ